MLKNILTLTCAVAALAAPVAANAQHGFGGGFHGGGGGFHGGGGYHGGGYHGGGYHGGYGGYRGGYWGHGWGWGGWGWGLGLGLGLGALWAYDSAPYYYYPAGYWGGDYGYYGYGGGYDDDDGYDAGYAPGAYSPAPSGPDAWSQEQAAEQPQANYSSPNATAPCGHWVWRADQSRYQWDASGC